MYLIDDEYLLHVSRRSSTSRRPWLKVEEDEERLASFLKSASVLLRVVSRLNPALPNMTKYNHRAREKKDPFTRVLSSVLLHRMNYTCFAPQRPPLQDSSKRYPFIRSSNKSKMCTKKKYVQT